MLQLAQIVPKIKNYKLFCDNWFTSIPLLHELAKIGIQCLGTVRPNRLPNISMPNEKKGRGNHEQRVTSVSGVEVRAVKYFDKRPVMFATTYASVEPIIKKLKYDSKQRKMIPVPTNFSLYNKHMGGVDRSDHLIALYRRVIRSKKFNHKTFYHSIDMICASAWQEYKQCCNILGVEKKRSQISFCFQNRSCRSILQTGKGGAEYKGKTFHHLCRTRVCKKSEKGPVKPIPSAPMRKDQIGHFPEFGKKGRCKMPGCKGITKISCIKCKINLCFTAKNNLLFIVSFMLICVTIFHYFLLFIK